MRAPKRSPFRSIKVNRAQRVRSRTDRGVSPAQIKRDYVFFSESVTEGHPDKLCDQISDAIVDRFLQQDPLSKVIAECAVSTAIAFVAARFRSKTTVDFATVAREVIGGIGYDHHAFNGKTCSIVTSLAELPADNTVPQDE